MADADPVVTYTRTGKFEEVREDLQLAIEGKGLVVDHVSYVGRMLERTGKDLGARGSPYRDAQAFQFCSAAVSRRTMEADLANVAFCPYTVVVYESAKAPGKVHVAYRRPLRAGASSAAQAALKEVEALLDAIAREAAGLR